MSQELQTCTNSHLLTISDNKFFLDNIQFEMCGIRVAGASQTQELTDKLISNLDDYNSHGINTITVFYQGCDAINSDPFSADGLNIDADAQARMEQIIQACDSRNMVLIVGVFYQNAKLRVANATAVQNVVKTVVHKLKNYRNIIINIANEQNSFAWYEKRDIYDFTNSQNIIDLCALVHQTDTTRLVGCGGYDHIKNEEIGVSEYVDALLFDTDSNAPGIGSLYNRFVDAGVTNKPIVCVELYGSWTSLWSVGIFPDSLKQTYFSDVDNAFSKCGLYIFFHNNPWCQGDPIRFDLAGMGTSSDLGIHWYFDYVNTKQLGSRKCI